MVVSDKYRRAWRRLGPAMGYLLLSGAAAAMNLLCGRIFAEDGPESLALVFLYPLSGGCAMYLLLVLLVPDASESEYHPIFLGLYNAGILLLTANQAVAGFFEITGKESSYISLIAIIGWILTVAGLMVLVLVVWDVHETGQRQDRNVEKPGWMKEEHHE